MKAFFVPFPSSHTRPQPIFIVQWCKENAQFYSALGANVNMHARPPLAPMCCVWIMDVCAWVSERVAPPRESIPRFALGSAGFVLFRVADFECEKNCESRQVTRKRFRLLPLCYAQRGAPFVPVWICTPLTSNKHEFALLLCLRSQRNWLRNEIGKVSLISKSWIYIGHRETQCETGNFEPHYANY
jgi:hypothetical protein